MSKSQFNYLFLSVVATTLLLLSFATTSSLIYGQEQQQQNNDEGIFIASPAWKFDNKVSLTDPSGSTHDLGMPYASSSGNFGYVIGGSQSLVSGNTTICVFDAMTNGTCVQTIAVLSGSWKVDNIQMANRVDGYMFDVRDRDIGTTQTIRWNSYRGIEWVHNRGIIAPRNTFVVDTYYNTFVSTEAQPDGKFESIVAAATVNHGYVQFWSFSVPILPGYQQDWTSYARDLIWMHKYGNIPVVGFISLGRVFALSTDNGTLLKEVDTPCGYASTEFHMRDITIKTGDKVLIVYGNTATHGFVVCALTLDRNLTQLWSIEQPFNITPANGDFSVNILRTVAPHTDGFGTFQGLYISGYKNNNRSASSPSYLWCFDVVNQSLAWEIPRRMVDVYNMPVFIGDFSNEHLAVTLNGTMTGLDPVTLYQKWACNTTKFGCRGTPAAYRGNGGELGRLICTATDSDYHIINLRVSSAANNFCTMAWETQIPEPNDVVTQNQPALVLTHWTPLEPFVAVLANTGTVWTMSVRSSTEPAPTNPPLPPTTPAPTLPPDPNLVGPLYQVMTQAPYDFTDLSIHNIPSVVPFSLQNGPCVAAVGETSFLEAQEEKRQKKPLQVNNNNNNNNNNNKNVGLGQMGVVFYYQSIPLGTSAVMDYNYIQLPVNYFFHSPVVVFSGSSQFVTASAEQDYDEDLILLYTDTMSTSHRGKAEYFGRYGATAMLATSGTGLFYYSVGVYNNVNELIISKKQRGDGTQTSLNWAYTLGNSAQNHFTNLTSHVGPITFATSGSAGYLIFSYLNQLTFVDALQGGDACTPVPNPCGFQPSTNTWELYYPMEVLHAQSPSEDLAIAVIDTWDQHGEATYGFCAYDLSATNACNSVFSFLLTNASWVANLQGIGNSSDIFAVDVFDNDWNGRLIVFDAKMGRELYSFPRDNAFGAVIIPYPGRSDLFVTTTDNFIKHNTVLTILDAKNGTMYGICDVGCDLFTLTTDSNGIPTFICQVDGFPRIVRALQFNPANNYMCTTTWQTEITFDSAIVAMSTQEINVEGKKYVSIILRNGFVLSVSPDAAPAPTPAPPIPTGYAHPSYEQIMNVSAQWGPNPKAATPVTTDLGSFPFSYGPVSFVTLAANMPSSSSSLTSTEGDTVQKSIILGYQAQVPTGKLVLDNVGIELSGDLITEVPLWIGRTGNRNGAAFATRNGEGAVYVISFPWGSFNVSRKQAYTTVATDKLGKVFFSIGSDGEKEQFVCYTLSDDGHSFTQTWVYPLPPPTPGSVLAGFSNVGNPTYIPKSVGATEGYVVFSFFNATYTLDSVTGALISKTVAPCGFVPPPDNFNNNAPYSMTPVGITLGNNSMMQIVISPLGASFYDGFYGICAAASSGQYSLWSLELARLTPNPIVAEFIISTTDVVGTNYFVMDISTQPDGDGKMIGINALTGAYWIKDRTKSTGLPPASKAYAGQYMVINWDDPTHESNFLSLVDATTGATSVQCLWSCRFQPVAADVVIDQVLQTVYVCAMSDHPNVVRAVYFKQIDGQSGYTCETYWEATLSENTLLVSPAGTSEISVGLASGATATFGLSSSVTPGTPVPQETTPVPSGNPATPAPETPTPGSNSGNAPSGGLSGGVTAAIVILILLAAAIAVGGIYLIRRRNVRRSAISEAASGMEYGASANSETQGYGAIA